MFCKHIFYLLKSKISFLFLALLGGLVVLMASCKKNTYEGSTERVTPPDEEFETLPNQSDEIFMIDGSPVIIKKINNVYYSAKDIMLSEQQVNALRLADNKELSTDERATVTTQSRLLWTKGVVPYKISDAAKRND